MTIKLRIDELILHGSDLPARRRAALPAAIARELQTLWDGKPPARARRPDPIAAQIARAIHREVFR